MFFRATFLLLGSSIVYGQETQEEEKINELEEVVISDSKFELKRENSGKTVITISRDEIDKKQGQTVAELINTKSGIEINGSRSNAGQNLNTFARGGNNRQILVLIDGVQISDPSNVNAEFDLRSLSLSQIESIEIIKGAASTLYGNAAAAAVISITTKKASFDTISATFQSSVGTNQTQEDQDYDIADFSNNVSINGTLQKFTYVAGFSNQYTDGLSAAIDGEERDPFSRINTNLKIGYDITDDFNVTLYGAQDKFRLDFDSPPLDAPNVSDNEQYRLGLNTLYKYKSGSFAINSLYNNVERIFDFSGFESVFESESLSVDAFNKYNFNDTFYTVAGVNYIYNEVVTDEADISTIDPYVNVVYISDFGFNMNVGGRLNIHSEYGTNVVYSANPSYTLKYEEGYAKIFGSYATSFIAPNIPQLFGVFGGNEDLEPETNTTIEGGVEVRLNDQLRISGLYFNRNEEDFIIYVDEDGNFNTLDDASYLNNSEDRTVHGAEVALEFVPTKEITLTSNYTFVESTDVPLIRIPKHKVNASLLYNFSDRSSVSIAYQYNSDRIDFGQSLEAFSLVDLNFTFEVLKNRMSLFGGVQNIFNEEYLEILSFATRGRNARVGFTLRF